MALGTPVSGDQAAVLAQWLQALWPGASSFDPGVCWFPLPVSMERKDINPVKHSQYAVCEKTDGERLVLYISSAGVFSVDRNIAFRQLDATVTGNLSQGTIADGELVRSKSDPSKLYILLFDCVAICGVPVHTETLWKRLGKCGTVCQHVRVAGADMLVKTMVDRSSMQAYCQTLGILDWKTDGFIFTPVRQPAGCATRWDTFKLKSRLDNTVDCVVQKMPERGRYMLYTREKNYRSNQSELVHFDTVTIPESIMSIQLDRYLDSNDTVICECQWDVASQRWGPKTDSHGWPMIRLDKSQPNSSKVAERTKLNVQEGIEPEELF